MADYTVLEVGSTDAGEIAACPHCGKNGLVEITNGMTFYVHKTGVDVEPNLLVAYEMCPKPLDRPAIP